MIDNASIRNWYNSFSGKQVKTGVNLRHYRIMNSLISGGLRRDSHVLEVGCGIGTLTGLLVKYLKRGTVMAVDISDESVAIARANLGTVSRVEFRTTDMTDFSVDRVFDFIVLPDVLEHIPVEQHRALFGVLASHMHDKSLIYINIPHPLALDYIRRTSPHLLQIIDQSVSADSMMADAYANGLILKSYVSYSIFDREDDYARVWFKKNLQLTLRPLPSWTIIINKLVARTGYLKARLSGSR